MRVTPRLMHSLRCRFGGRFPAARFTHATFTGDSVNLLADFEGVTFAAEADFEHAVFMLSSGAYFRKATFRSPAYFDHAKFANLADFSGVSFSDVSFDHATFQQDALFVGAHFESDASFAGTRFDKHAAFGEVTFETSPYFSPHIHDTAIWQGTDIKLVDMQVESNFGGPVLFNDAIFRAPVILEHLSFADALDFSRARLARGGWVSGVQARQMLLSSVQCRGGLILKETEVKEDIDLSGSFFQGSLRLDDVAVGRRLDVSGGTLEGSVRISLKPTPAEQTPARPDGCAVELSDAALGAPTLVETVLGVETWRPRLLSLRGTDASHLTLARIDLGDARLVGTANLDRLRIDGPPLFRKPPGRWRTSRQVISEECGLRAWPGPDGRTDPGPLPPRTRTDARELASQIHSAYRDLRKGREDAKDEPGAADFYYGEMEMRRRSTSSPLERALLAAYWGVSGYGLRAWRALAALALVLTAATAGFRLGGIRPSPGWRDAALYTLHTSTSLLQGQTAAVVLTRWGQLIEIAVRLLTPLLAGLALLAVRGRVKR